MKLITTERLSSGLSSSGRTRSRNNSLAETPLKVGKILKVMPRKGDWGLPSRSIHDLLDWNSRQESPGCRNSPGIMCLDTQLPTLLCRVVSVGSINSLLDPACYSRLGGPAMRLLCGDKNKFSHSL